MKKSSMLSRTYCQLHKVWFGQKGLTTWAQNVLPATSLHVCRQSAQPRSVRNYCTDATAGESDQQEFKMPPGVGSFLSNEPTNIEKSFRTPEDDVTKHEAQHASKYYKVKKDDYEKFFKLGHSKRFSEQINTFRECGVMIRKPALEVFQIAECADLSLPPPRILLYGEYGVGKSLTLSHVVHRLSEQGFVTVHFPNVKNRIAHRPFRPRELVVGDDGVFQHTDEAVDWLKLFQAQNKGKLDDVKIHEECVFTAREKIDVDSSIMDVITFGIARKQFASICIGVVLKELRLAATDKKIKVLVAIDGVNVFWKDLHLEKKKVPAQQFLMLRRFMEMCEPTWSNGIVVGTLCSDVAAVDVVGLDRKEMDTTPHGLLRKEGFKFMDPFIPVEVSRYNKEEAINCLDYYIDNHWIAIPYGRTKEGKEELMALSAKHPLELMDICAYW